MVIGKEIAGGALANVGALKVNDSARSKFQENKPDLNPRDVTWMMTVQKAEANASKNRKRVKFPTVDDVAMQDWFVDKGGKIEKVEYGVPTETALKASGRNRRGVIATEMIEEGETVISVPLKLTMSQLSARNVKTKGGYLGDDRHLKDAFKHNQEWALAMMLLHELYKTGTGEGSVSKLWGPYLETLRFRGLSKSVMKELRGTYGAELLRTWDEEAAVCLDWMQDKICQKHSSELCLRDPNNLGSQRLSRDDMKWALQIVRSYAVRVYKVTTRKSFLALVPFVDMIGHRTGAGGNVTLGLDNLVRVNLGEHAEGMACQLDRNPLTDAESLLKYHVVDEEENEHNALRLHLPGSGRSWPGQPLYFQTDTLREWRVQQSLPPRTADLWRQGQNLHLWGDEEDVEEQKMLEAANNRMRQMGLDPDKVNPEEVLMLEGRVSNSADAALAIRGNNQIKESVQLYMPPDPEDDERAAEATTKLADYGAQLQRSALVNPDVNGSAIQKVMNQTRNFFLHGIKPHGGLDEVDLLLLRKMSLLDQCHGEVRGEGGGDGPGQFVFTHEFRVTPQNVSDPLMCAVRIHVMNETELDVLCAALSGPAAWEPTCEDQGGDFQWDQPISPENELLAIGAVRQSLSALRNGYGSSDEDDQAMELLTTIPPLTRAAVQLRVREKSLLDNAMKSMDDREENLGNLTFQLVTRMEQQLKFSQAKDDHVAYAKKLQEDFFARRTVINMPVKLGGGRSANLTVYEGEDLAARVKEFAAANKLAKKGAQMLEKMARGRIKPKTTPALLLNDAVITNGTRQLLMVPAPAVNVSANVTQSALEFCMIHGVVEEDWPEIIRIANISFTQRMKRKSMVNFPVGVPDGRSVVLDIRRGEQHDIKQTVRDFVAAHHLGDATLTNGLIDIVEQRLPKAVMRMEVPVGGKRTLELRICEGDNVKEEITLFLQVYRVPMENLERLTHAALANMHQNAHTMNYRG